MADFVSAMEIHTERANPIYKEHPDKIPKIFRDLSPITGAIKAVNLLLESPLYEVFILSTAPWNNPSAWTDKRLWLEDKFGDSINRRLILTHRKDLVKGDILIDDRPNNGAKDFEGEWIHFGTENFPDWSSVIKHLL
ncbi:hypothetical protein OAB13_01110 [Salibacteraceae bacterium]|nr:hypothetical protein [Salibacteraceae bacterium]